MYFRHIRSLLLGSILMLSSVVMAQLNTDRITSIGRNALYFEDYVLSIQYFNQVIKLKPYLAEPYQLRAIAKIQLSDYQGALRDCNAAIERNPFQPGAYYTRGYVYRQLGEHEKAEQDFTEALIFSRKTRPILYCVQTLARSSDGTTRLAPILITSFAANPSLHHCILSGE